MSSTVERRLRQPPPPAPPSTLEVTNGAAAEVTPLEAEIIRQMAAAWHDGRRIVAEQWLAEHPELRAQHQCAVRIVYEEICLRQEHGEAIESEEFYRRFPQWKSELAVLLDCHRLVEAEAAPASMPAAGERFGEFELLSELGRGAAGRVYLAMQPALSDRLLVVKLSPRCGDEHLSLARLQHTHIVPLYLVQDFPAEHLRAMCMPYVGGASLAQVLESLRNVPPGQRTGQQLADAVSVVPQGAPPATSFTGPALRFLSRATYVEAICWIGACLADALHYAHQRGLVHLDLKPSNVLLAADGQPMLLDFHLASEVIPAGTDAIDSLGGTRGYMSPEQQSAAEAVRDGQTIEQAVDGRSDIYSLGVLLYEMLSGRLPPADRATRHHELRERNPAISRSVEDLVLKCLAQEPSARYRDAGELAADLRRHLAFLPLRGVPNRSWRERWQKWRRRQPHALALVSMAAISFFIVGSLAVLFVGQHARAARQALEVGQGLLEHRDYSGAIQQFDSAARAIAWLPGQQELKTTLQNRSQAARRARWADHLHALVRQLRFVESFASVPASRLRELDTRCRAIWEAGTQIVRTHDIGGEGAAGDQLESQLRTDLLDLALHWADLRVCLAPPEQLDDARRRAMQLLDEAQALCGSSPAVEFVRRQYDRAVRGEQGPPPIESVQGVRTAWEHDALGRALLRAGQLPQAMTQFDEALAMDAGAFWPNYYRAVCAYRSGDYTAAVNAAYACVALSPNSPECFYNRGLAQQALQRNQPALADYEHALKLDPAMGVAAYSASTLLTSQRRFDEAADVLRTAMKHGADPASIYYHLALVDLGRKDRWSALKNLGVALKFDAAYAPAVALEAELMQTP